MSSVALVTGSSRGIGREIAIALAEKGFRVIVHGRTSSEALDKTVQAIRSRDGIVEPVIFDLRNVSRGGPEVAEIFDKFGTIQCLVNNAGVSVKRRGDLLDIAEDSFDEQYHVNVRGAFFLTQGVARRMLSQDKSLFHSIINITSSNAVAASIERGEYCMAKSSLSMMSKLLSVRLASEGINVYEVRPGLIRTDMTRLAAEMYDRKIAQGFSPINRWGEPGDVAEAIVPLAQGAFRFATGDIFHIDGGLVLTRY